VTDRAHRGKLDGLEPWSRVLLGSSSNLRFGQPSRGLKSGCTLSVSALCYGRLSAAAKDRKMSRTELVEDALASIIPEIATRLPRLPTARAPDPWGEALRAWRLSKGWTQVELGRRLGGVTDRTISEYEKGTQRARPRRVAALIALGFEPPATPGPAVVTVPVTGAQIELGDALRAWRVARDQSLERLAAEVKSSAPVLSRAENGHGLSYAVLARLQARGFQPPTQARRAA
jgi:transcriptional regulator with XRE-family HTH domain